MTTENNPIFDFKIKQTVKDAGKKVKQKLRELNTSAVGVLEEGAKFIAKSGIPVVSQIAGFLSFGADRVKDAMIDAKFGGLADSIGDLQDGLNNVQNQLESQGKALKGAIDGVKSELQGQLKQQGENFDEEIRQQDAKIAALSGEQKRQAEETKKALQQQKQELESQINQVTANLNRVENKLTNALNDLRNEMNERFEEVNKKILDNKRKIEEERLQREEEIRETQSKIKLTNTHLENLRKEKEQLNDDILNYKSQINQQTAETQQAFEDTQAEYDRRTRIVEAKIADNEELLEEFTEDLTNVKFEQKKLHIQTQELAEELAEQSDLLNYQKHKLEFVANQVEEVAEEIHGRMNKVQREHNNLLNLAQETSQQVNNLTNEINNTRQQVNNLEEQVKNNKQDIENAKEEAKRANEKLDSLIKSQELKDYSAELSNIDKLQKSLELKAEETKLLATLKLLQKTKELIPLATNEREWKVGIKTGSADKDLSKPEGFPLVANSWWERNYTGTQVKPDNPHSIFTPEWFNWEEENKLAPEDTKFEPWGERIKADNETAPLTTEDKREEQQIQPDQENNQSSADKNQNSAEPLEQIEALKSKILEQLQTIQEDIDKNITELENKPTPTKNNTPKNYSSPIQQELEQSLNDYEESLREDKQEELVSEWENIQELSEQVLSEPTPLSAETPELDLNKKLEELTQQLKEQEQSVVASQKQMTKWMLFLIIFLLEYVVYKKNGVLGLVLLNVILAICYYKKEEIFKYQHLWEKYFLIIGYVLGNALAYSVPEQEKYKWPSVIAFNVIALSIYAYTYWQEQKAKLQITQKQEQIQQLQQEEFQQEQELKQATEIQRQTEILQQAATIENNLKEIHSNLGNSRMTWQKIKERYPDFANRSILLKELSSVDKLLNKKDEKQPNQNFLNKLERIPSPTSAENNLLSQLHLTLDQFIAISCHVSRLTNQEKEWLTDNYTNLDNNQQLSLLNAGLTNLGINNLDKKEIFVTLNHQLYQEQRQFGLATKEKENILRLLINTLSLTKEQQEYLEGMGVSFFNAANWQIDNEQQNQLLKFGLNKIDLSEEQNKLLSNLSSDRFKTFSLTGEQKNILQSLAPLSRQDKYSPNSLKLLNSLRLKPTTLSFFINEEILPDPNLEFGEVTSPYLPLKLKYLTGEQKILQTEEKINKQNHRKQEIAAQKLAIYTSLVNFAVKKYQKGEELHHLNYSLEEWVNISVLKPYQVDILLTLGLKTIPQYNFFELFIFALENFTEYTRNDLENSDEETKADYQKYLESQKNKPLILNKFNWVKYSGHSSQQQEAIANLNLEELINKQIQQALSNYQPAKEEENISEYSEETPPVSEPTATSSRYDDLLNNLSGEETERLRKKQEREEANKKLAEAERLRREAKLSEKDRKLKEDAEKREQERLLQEQEDLKRKEAEEQRAKILQEEQETYLKTKLENIEKKKKAAEQALANQQKENELSEQKKRDEITKLEQENQQEQERLIKQAQLIEEEKQKQLAKIALEDKEQRQIIEKRANEEKARIESEMNEKKRKNEAELKQKENQLKRERDEKKIELDRLQKDIDLQRTLGEEAKRLGQEQERILRQQKGLSNQLSAFRETLWNAVLDYYWVSSEAQAGTRSPNLNQSGHLREWLNSCPNMEFNLNFGDIMNDINWSGYKTAMQAFYRTAGNRFVNQYQFKQLLEQKVKSLDFLN